MIQTIRDSRTRDSARNNLQRNFRLSEQQANAILEMQLGRLAALERKKIDDEYREVSKFIAELEDMLGNVRKVLYLMKQDLAYLKAKYGDGVRTRSIADASCDICAEDLMPDV